MGRPVAWRLAHALLAIWIGAMIAQAFVGAPLVFGAVPEHIATKDSAARVIGPGFARIDMLGVIASAILIAVYAARGVARSWRGALAFLLLIGAAVDAFVIAPAIIARTEPLRVYHGTATAIWMTAIIVGVVLLLVPQAGEKDPARYDG